MTEKNDNNNRIGKILHFERDSSFFVKRGDAKRAKNDPVSAVSLYAEALELDPSDLDTRLAAAEVLTDMSRFNDSNRMLIPYMHLDEEFKKEAYCIAGFNFLGMGENEGAKICFDRFFELTDEVSERTDAILDALDYIESTYEEPSNLSDAASIGRDEKVFEAFRAVDIGDFPKAQTLLMKLNERFPKDKEILYKLSLSCLCCKDFPAADKYLSELLSLDPDNWGAMSMKLICDKALNNEIELSRLSKQLENCDSNDPDTLLRVNGALIEIDMPELAAKPAQRLCRILPFDSLSNHRLGICYIEMKEFSKAAEIYDKLVRIDKQDRIARFYRNACREAAEKPGIDITGGQHMVQYQIPLHEILNDVRSLLDVSKVENAEDILRKWFYDADFKDMIRWSFTLREYNTIHAVVNMLSFINDEASEMLLRELIADIDVSETIVNDTLGALKRMGAVEPFFAVSSGRLLEGRVNIVDLSDVKIPKSYRDILPRIYRSAGEQLGGEVMSVASSIAERFIMLSLGEFSPLSRERSEALSAAIEFLACERCGVPAREDIYDRYSVTEKRLSNAIRLLINVLMSNADETSEEVSGGTEDEDQ